MEADSLPSSLAIATTPADQWERELDEFMRDWSDDDEPTLSTPFSHARGDYDMPDASSEVTPTPAPKKRLPPKTNAVTKQRKKAPAKHPTSKPIKAIILYNPVFARRPPLTEADIPSDMDHDTYKAWLQHVPDPENIICLCKKRAGAGEVQLVECSGPDCKIRWFHRSCLEKSMKLQIRFGTMLCVLCRDAKHFKDLAKEKGWSIDKLIEEETKLAFSAAEVFAYLPEPGGSDKIANAYGLGLQDDVVEAAPVLAVEDERRLPFSMHDKYVQARPQQFFEAYENAEANRKIADEEFDNRLEDYDEEGGTDGDNELEWDEEEEEEEDEDEDEETDGSAHEDEEDDTNPITHWRGAEIVHAI